MLRGGPPEWEGVVARVCDVEAGPALQPTLERTCHVSGLSYVWTPTDAVEDVEVDREVKAGTVRETKTAQVYAAVGYREDIISEGSTSAEGRQVLAPRLWEDEADGDQEDADPELGGGSGA